MRHRKAHRKLGRDNSHRKAMLRNLVTSLIEHEEVKTTEAKAKEVRRVAERMITLGKRGTLHARRQALKTCSKDATSKVFDVLADRYDQRAGGYTRIYKLGRRVGDNAPMSLIQLLPEDEGAEEAESES